jgi:phosphoglycolate phosphatase-like HAD superfamily hydrolase
MKTRAILFDLDGTLIDDFYATEYPRLRSLFVAQVAI